MISRSRFRSRSMAADTCADTSQSGWGSGLPGRLMCPVADSRQHTTRISYLKDRSECGSGPVRTSLRSPHSSLGWVWALGWLLGWGGSASGIRLPLCGRAGPPASPGLAGVLSGCRCAAPVQQPTPLPRLPVTSPCATLAPQIQVGLSRRTPLQPLLLASRGGWDGGWAQARPHAAPWRAIRGSAAAAARPSRPAIFAAPLASTELASGPPVRRGRSAGGAGPGWSLPRMPVCHQGRSASGLGSTRAGCCRCRPGSESGSEVPGARDRAAAAAETSRPVSAARTSCEPKPPHARRALRLHCTVTRTPLSAASTLPTTEGRFGDRAGRRSQSYPGQSTVRPGHQVQLMLAAPRSSHHQGDPAPSSPRARTEGVLFNLVQVRVRNILRVSESCPSLGDSESQRPRRPACHCQCPGPCPRTAGPGGTASGN